MFLVVLRNMLPGYLIYPLIGKYYTLVADWAIFSQMMVLIIHGGWQNLWPSQNWLPNLNLAGNQDTILFLALKRGPLLSRVDVMLLGWQLYHDHLVRNSCAEKTLRIIVFE